jgi:uncharacterized membrane protein
LSIVQHIIDITVKESKSLTSVDLIIGEDIHKAQWQKKDHAIQATLDSSQLSLITVYWKEVNNSGFVMHQISLGAAVLFYFTSALSPSVRPTYGGTKKA